MATVNTFDEFFNHLATGVHGNMNTAVFKIMLSSTAPTKGTNAVRADVVAGVVTGGGYADATIAMTWAETGAGTGIWQLGGSSSDVTFTPSSTAYSDFRYAYLYNDTPTSPADPLIAVLDYGSTVTALAVGSPFEVNAGANGWVRYTTPTWV